MCVPSSEEKIKALYPRAWGVQAVSQKYLLSSIVL